jgi:hypothetical protein
VRASLPAKAAILISWLASAAPTAADPVRFEDLRLLVEGGVGEAAILRHLERWGLERDLSASELVALRRAGAGESLLASLAGAAAAGVPSERSVPLPDGRGVLLTNLDETGRRLGGEVPRIGREETEARTARAEAVGTEVFGPGAPDPEPADLWAAVEPAEERRTRWPIPDPGLEPRRGRECRLGTPGGYTRYKLYHSSRPDDGFRTWVLPTYWLVRPAWPWLPPAVVAYVPPYWVF